MASDLANTQSPAPGLAAAIDLFQRLCADHLYPDLSPLLPLVQANAAAVETVSKEDYEGVMRMLAEQRATNAKVAELIFQNDRVEAVKWAKGLTTDGALCWVEAPPLPAQVQAAEALERFTPNAELYQGMAADSDGQWVRYSDGEAALASTASGRDAS